MPWLLAQVEQDKVTHEVEQDEYAVQHSKAWDLDITEKHRMARIMDAKEEFAQQIVDRRKEQFEALRVRACPRAAAAAVHDMLFHHA